MRRSGRGPWGFFNRAAEKQGQRLVDRHGEPGECPLVRELVEDVDGRLVPGVRPRDRQLSAITTDRALYFDRGPTHVRVPYDAVAYVAGGVHSAAFEVTTHDRVTLCLRFPASDAGLGRSLRERLARLAPLRMTRVVAGEFSVTIEYHPWRLDVMSYWTLDGLDGVPRRGDIEAGVRELREAAGRELLDQAISGPITIPEWNLVSDLLGHDWNEPLGALVAHHGLSPPGPWSVGHLFGKDGVGHDPFVVTVTDQAVCLASFESMRPLILADRTPRLARIPLPLVADWSLAYESDGRAALRLLEVTEEALRQPSLQAVVESGKGLAMDQIGLADPTRAATVAEEIIERVRRFGAFSPGTRPYHPLQQNGS